jgi:hypothetical protein
MTHWTRILLVTALLLLSATSVAASNKYNFDYKISNGQSLTLLRVFDDGKNTVLAFRNLSAITPTVTTGDGTVLRYRRVDNYAVLQGLYSNLTVLYRGQIARVDQTQQLQDYSGSRLAYEAPLPNRNASGAYSVAARTTQTAYTTPRSVAEQTLAQPSPAPQAAAATPVPPVTLPISASAVAIAPVAIAAPAVPPAPTWSATSGASLQDVLNTWTKNAGWAPVRWDNGYRYQIPVAVNYQGSLLEAAARLIRDFKDAEHAPKGRIYPGQKLIVVEEGDTP